MSNTLAVAAVTSVLRFVLEKALGGSEPDPVGSALVTTLHPADIPAKDTSGELHKGINVYLYRVTPNNAGDLTDLPTRRAGGSLAHRPTAALDLHYLITFHGDDAQLDAQRLLGRTVLALAVTPVLTRDLVTQALDEYDEDTDTKFLEHADLAAQMELVKFAPASMGVEELGRLWSALGTGYRLGLTYTATMVVLEAALAARTALPVRHPAVAVTTVSRPRVDRVVPPPGAAVATGVTVDVVGSALIGRGVAVRIGPVELPPGRVARADRLPVTVTAAVPAGVHPVQVVHRAADRVLGRSNAVPVLVRPAVALAEVTDDAVRLAVTPPIFPGQRAVVTLTSETAVLTFQIEPAGAEVELARDAVPDGRWQVRISVDGAESLPALDGETYTAPTLDLP